MPTEKVLTERWIQNTWQGLCGVVILHCSDVVYTAVIERNSVTHSMILMALRMRMILKMRSTLMTLRILPSLVESLIASSGSGFKVELFMHCCGSKGKWER